MIRLGLTSKLSVLFACIGVIASGATGYYTYRANRAMLVQEAQHSLLMSTQLLGQRFTTALADVADDALVLAQLPSAPFVAGSDSPDRARRARLEQVYYSFMRNHPEYLQVRLIASGHFGIERIRVDRDANGIVVLPESALQEKGQFSYVFDTLATPPGHIYLSPIAINHETGSHAAEGCRSCVSARRSSTCRAVPSARSSSTSSCRASSIGSNAICRRTMRCTSRTSGAIFSCIPIRRRRSASIAGGAC